MRSILVVSPTEITPRMLADFVKSARGHWFDSHDVESGTFEEGESAVYITAITPLSTGAYETSEIEAIQRMLDDVPRSCIELDIGSGENSFALAWKIAHRMISVWGGVIDDCRGSFWPGGSACPEAD